MPPPEIIVTIEQVGAYPEGGRQYLTVTARSSWAEICRNTSRSFSVTLSLTAQYGRSFPRSGLPALVA